MAFEAMETIKMAESAAEKKKIEAVQEAKRLAARAEADGKQLVDEAVKKARQEIAELAEEEQKKTLAIRDRLLSETQAMEAELKLKATEKLPEAAAFILERIVNS